LGGIGRRTAEINRLAVRLAQEARDNVAPEKPVAIAGSMSTFIPKVDPTVTPSYGAALADYQEQAQVLAEAGVDLFVLEMLVRTGDARAAVEAASATGLPVWVGYSLQRDDGHLYLGVRGKWSGAGIAEAVEAVAAMGVSAFFIMHTTLEDTGAGLLELRQRTSLPIGAYAHALVRGPGQGESGAFVLKPLGPAEYLSHGREWVNMGAQIIGGCCGIAPEHIEALSQGLPPKLPS
jgi:S-methylmethionine-dependent homocysteine/selenocysteine methylase